MTDIILLGPWVRRFLLEYLVTECNLARNTQRSYRDTFCLLIPFVAHHAKKEVDQIAVVGLGSTLSSASGGVPEMRRGNAQPATGCDPLIGSLHWHAQPGAHRLVRTTPNDPAEKGTSIDYHVPREIGDGGAAECSGSTNGPGAS